MRKKDLARRGGWLVAGLGILGFFLGMAANDGYTMFISACFALLGIKSRKGVSKLPGNMILGLWIVIVFIDIASYFNLENDIRMIEHIREQLDDPVMELLPNTRKSYQYLITLESKRYLV